MKEAREATGLNVICEVTGRHAIETAVRYVDMLQIGARNMQNFELLKEAGKSGLPVLLKRGISATIDEWLNAAEYIMSEGNHNVVLCERGVRAYVRPLAKCAVAAGADGLMIEVHPTPACALSDGPQSLTFEQFEQLTGGLRAYAGLEGRSF